MKTVILGAGITGLAAGLKTGYPIFEATDDAGGICRSYEIDGFQFQNGGGHWIFGQNEYLKVLHDISRLKIYDRKAGIYINSMYKYPIQYVNDEIPVEVGTLKDWNRKKFGPGMCNVFFDPFNERYTAGYYNYVVQDDPKKSPTKGAGYNSCFHYPEKGLSDLIDTLAGKCDIEYNAKVLSINIYDKTIRFVGGEQVKYDRIISTLPLSKMMDICGLQHSKLPHTSVLVLNIGADKGKDLPDSHWVYFPDSKSGFFRVGIYSNVDTSFAPEGKVGFYVEKSFANGYVPSEYEVSEYKKLVMIELAAMGWISLGNKYTIDSNFIPYAYTWMFPGNERESSIKTLNKYGIEQIGRYGKWRFQGILESFEDGMSVEV